MLERKFDHWTRLAGMEVQVRLESMKTITGTVDSVMPDSSMLWLQPLGDQRRLIEKSQGHEIWIDLPGKPSTDKRRH